MDIYFFSGFLLSALLSCVFGQSCEQSYYQRCLTQLVAFSDRKDLLFASSSDELRHQCVQAQASLGCLLRYSKNCLSSEEGKKFDEVIAGPRKVTNGLCGDEDDFRSRYLESLPCLRNMSTGLQYCTEKYDRNQNDIELMTYEHKTQLQCCSFEGYRRCLQMLMYTQDGCRESGDVVDEIASRLGGTLSDDACAEFVGRCTGPASSGITLKISFSLLTALNVLLLVLFSQTK